MLSSFGKRQMDRRTENTSEGYQRSFNHDTILYSEILTSTLCFIVVLQLLYVKNQTLHGPTHNMSENNCQEIHVLLFYLDCSVQLLHKLEPLTGPLTAVLNSFFPADMDR
ncbi:hypothetical protein AMECASPLE_033359 [Ameca splendens]|uniref:Uncharacterized protein n=1 Tax=Ameca splendens TaxID=208324 RepID=A0ABV0ZFL8_9TELE